MSVKSRIIQQGRRNEAKHNVAVAASASEKRWAHRRAQQTPALIVTDSQILGKQAPPINCTVKDTSSTGALIQLSSATADRWSADSKALPETFRLQIPSELVEVRCRIAWREETMIGVRFIAPATMLAKPERKAPAKPEKPKMLIARLFGN